MAGGNDELAFLLLDVLQAIGVVLEFVIAPTVAASFDGPVFRVRSRTIRSIKFVAPDEGPDPRIGDGSGTLLLLRCRQPGFRDGGRRVRTAVDPWRKGQRQEQVEKHAGYYATMESSGEIVRLSRAI